MKCPYCSAAQGRCATTPSGRSITECVSCGRVVEERQHFPHHLFHFRAQDNPLPLVTSDLQPINDAASPAVTGDDAVEDPFLPTGFVTAFSTFSLEPSPLSLRTSLSFSGHLAELERILESSSNPNSNPSATSSSTVVVDNLRAYMQIVDVASILGLDYYISEHAFKLFRDCCSATCLRNRSVEALATAALVQAIREAQEPRTLQEISIAANVPQKEIGKYIKILGEALQLSQPINSNSISVHMPRFCSLLQLNKSAQVLATHIGEVVINKCFCTRRNPISISAAAIYLACQLEDKRKTQAEICKVTGLTEVTLRKVYKELLENWDDLLPSNYTPAVPPEKAFPTTAIASGRSSAPKTETIIDLPMLDREKPTEPKLSKADTAPELCPQVIIKNKEDSEDTQKSMLNLNQTTQVFRQPWLAVGEKNVNESPVPAEAKDFSYKRPEFDKEDVDKKSVSPPKLEQVPGSFSLGAANAVLWPYKAPTPSSSSSSSTQFSPLPKLLPGQSCLKPVELEKGK